jgi:hypothetical protein
MLAGIAAGEVLLRLPFAATLRQMVANAGRARHVLTSRRISDHWKERAIPAYALRMGLASLRFLGLLALVALAAVLPGLAYPPGVGTWIADLAGPAAIGVLGLVSLAYLWLRTRRRHV